MPLCNGPAGFGPAGKGHAGRNGGQPGDLFLRVHIAPDPVFRVNGRDLETDLPISPWEAALGAEVEVGTVDGSSRIRLKPGTQSGQKIVSMSRMTKPLPRLPERRRRRTACEPQRVPFSFLQ